MCQHNHTAVSSRMIICEQNLNVYYFEAYSIFTACRKTSKVLIDHIKVVIKSGKKHTSQEKLRSIVLLDKCLIQAKENKEFVNYFQKKIMERLKIMGGYCPKTMQVSDASNLGQRGAHIFLPDEPDTAHAAQYLTQLLIYLKSWATHFPTDANR